MAHRCPTFILGIAGVLFLSSCAPKTKFESGPPAAELEKQAAEADAQFKRGCYAGFKKAIEIYQGLYARPSMRRMIAFPYVRALLLLMIREREVGIVSHGNYKKALAVIRENPALVQFRPYAEIADALSPRTRGIMQDITAVTTDRVYDEVFQKTQNELKAKALIDDYHAYLYVTFLTGYGYYERPIDDFTKGLLDRYPESVFLKYKKAIYPRPDRERLSALLGTDPGFSEAYYHLGELAIGERKLLEAESNFLKALDGLAESPQVNIFLAGIYTATEEFEKSLEYFDRTIALSPEYRDAFLGKGICLSFMGKYREAIAVLDKIVQLGLYMLGESHYWLAWNYRELKDDDQARANIEESKSRLPMNSEVFGLAGMIAFEKGDLDRAEKEFLEALKYNGENTEALFSLGRLYGEREKWPDSGAYSERAAYAFKRNESAIADKIKDIKESALSEERKARMLAKKEQQLKNTRATEATAFYSAAVGYFHAGGKAKALEMASRAAVHPQFKEKAEDLIKKIL